MGALSPKETTFWQVQRTPSWGHNFVAMLPSQRQRNRQYTLSKSIIFRVVSCKKKDNTFPLNIVSTTFSIALYTMSNLKILGFVINLIHLCSPTNYSLIGWHFIDSNHFAILQRVFLSLYLRPCFVCWHPHMQVQEHLSAKLNVML